MNMEGEEFFDGFTPGEAEAAPVEQAQTTEAAKPEPTTEQTVAEPTTQQEPPAAEVKPDPKPEPGHVPITALLDEREKRKELERQLNAMRDAQVQQTSQPDPVADPHGYQQHLMQQVQQTVMDTRLNMSETAARRHYGAELTDSAKTWALEKFGANPAFQQEVTSQPDPYGYAVEAFKRDQIASQVTPDTFEQFKAWQAAQAQIAAAPAAAPPPPMAASPPRSIVSAPSAGGKITDQPLTEEEAFSSIFSK